MGSTPTRIRFGLCHNRRLPAMSKLINLARSSAVFLMGRESKPRKILFGLAAGCRINVSPAERLSYLFGTAESHLQKAIRRYVAKGDNVYDIGANIGYVSLSLACRVGSAGRVIAFEPVPKNLELLRGNIAENALTNVKVMDAAASDVCGETTIRIAHNLATASLVWHRNEPSAVEFSVNTVVIDELVKTGDLPPPSFVKIDVEGAEAFVVRGMLRTIAAAKPVLFIECSDAGREITWPLLRNLGYRCQSAITLRWIENLAEYRHSDFLWLPPERVAA